MILHESQLLFKKKRGGGFLALMVMEENFKKSSVYTWKVQAPEGKNKHGFWTLGVGHAVQPNSASSFGHLDPKGLVFQKCWEPAIQAEASRDCVCLSLWKPGSSLGFQSQAPKSRGQFSKHWPKWLSRVTYMGSRNRHRAPDFIILLEPFPLFTKSSHHTLQVLLIQGRPTIFRFLFRLIHQFLRVLPRRSIYSLSSHVEKVSNSSKPCWMRKESRGAHTTLAISWSSYIS